MGVGWGGPCLCVSTSWLIYLDKAKAQMCLVKRQLRVNHDFKNGNRWPLPLCKPQRGAAVRRHCCRRVTCPLRSSCWAAGRTTAAAACESPLLTAALAGRPRRIWRCVPAPSWRAASTCPDTCPSLPAGTAPTSRCGHTWWKTEDIYATFEQSIGKCWWQWHHWALQPFVSFVMYSLCQLTFLNFSNWPIQIYFIIF